MATNTKWIKIDLATGDALYTNVSRREPRPQVVGPGDREPTPKEIIEALERKDIDYISRFSTGIGFKEEYIEQGESSVLPHELYRYFPGSWNLPPGLLSTKLRQESAIERKIYKEISEDINKFIASKETYNKANVFFKRGLLMYGPPGEGKTTIIRQLIEKALPENAISILTGSVPSESLVTHLQDTEPDRLKVYIIEEIASMIYNPRHDMREILDFLDGHSSPDNTLFIATTNYPEVLPGNIIERPSRFDLLTEVKAPDRVEVKQLIKLYLSKAPSANEVKQLVGLSTAAIKEVCMMARLHNKNIELAVLKFKARQEAVKEWRTRHRDKFSIPDLFAFKTSMENYYDGDIQSRQAHEDLRTVLSTQTSTNAPNSSPARR